MTDAIPLHRRPTSLDAMVGSIVSLMEPYASSVGVKLKTEIDAGLPATVSIDEDKIAWTIGTLIGNALRHVPRGSFFHPAARSSSAPPANLTPVKSSSRSRTTALGIPADKVPLLFQPAPYQRRVGYALILAREIAIAHRRSHGS